MADTAQNNLHVLSEKTLREHVIDGSADYRALLVKYIAHICNQEGIDFLDHDPDPFSDHELAELRALAKSPACREILASRREWPYRDRDV